MFGLSRKKTISVDLHKVPRHPIKRRNRHLSARSGKAPKWQIWVQIAFGILFIFTVIYLASFVKRVAQGESSTEPYPVCSARLQVLNGTGKSGMARKIADLYRKSAYHGVFFDVVDEANSGLVSVEKTLVVSRNKDKSLARATAAVLGIDDREIVVRTLEDNVLNLQVTLIIGNDIDSLLVHRLPKTAGD